jgi:hypothetical protein
MMGQLSSGQDRLLYSFSLEEHILLPLMLK